MSMLSTLTRRTFWLAGLLLIASWFFLAPSPAAAQTIDLSNPISLEGFAWSGYTDSDGNRVGVGWIDMSGVTIMPINPAQGNLEGYAWSDNIGWIKFGGLSSFPGPGNNAQLNGASGQLSGWARACSATVGGDCTSMATDLDAGGWDGWISLQGGGYGIRFDVANPISGTYRVEAGNSYAWGGSTVMGWIDFTQVTLGDSRLTATDCTITVGTSDCDTTVAWDATGLTDPQIHFDRGIGEVFGPLPETGSDTQTLSGEYANETPSYTVELRDGATVIDSATIQVSCATGSDWDPVSSACQLPGTSKPDLILQNMNSNTGSYNVVTGEYSNVDFLFRMRNQGATTTAYEGESSVEWNLDYSEAHWPTNDSLSGSVPAIGNGDSRQVTADAGTLRFGIYEFTVIADPADDIDEEVEGNNTATATVTFLPQDPSMSLTAMGSQIIRSGSVAEISWDTVAEYPMDCTVSGPGIVTQTFDPSISGTTNTVTTSPRFNTSVYTMTCDVDYPGINTTFSASARVEVIPRLEEI